MSRPAPHWSRCQLVIPPVLLTLIAAVPAAQAQVTLATGAQQKAAHAPGLDDPAVIYFVGPACDTPGVPNETSPARIVRVPTLGGTPRDLAVFNPERPAGTCNPFRIASNIVVDEQSVFWIDNEGPNGGGVKRQARLANPEDPPVELVPLGGLSGELVSAGSRLYVILRNVVRVGTDSAVDLLTEVEKDGGTSREVYFTAADTMFDLQFDGRWVWWREDTRLLQLRRYDTVSGAVDLIDDAVDGYLSSGDESQCIPGEGCEDINTLYFGTGRELRVRNTFDPATERTLYTSPRADATLREIVRDTQWIFFWESAPSGTLFRADHWLYRLSPIGGTPDLLQGPLERVIFGPNRLSTDYIRLYWHDSGNIFRLPNNAEALPVFDVVATGTEVSQGIQNPRHAVRLIEGRRTVVRVHVRSERGGDAADVAAALSGTNLSGLLGVLEPVNRTGKRIVVRANPRRAQLDHSFQFELPLHWTTGGPLQLTARINPDETTYEDNIENNAITAGPFEFSASPRLPVRYVNFWYRDVSVPALYTTNWADEAASREWIRTVYPLQRLPSVSPATPGLDETSTDVVDDGMLTRVNRTADDCRRFLDTSAMPPVDDRDMCAAAYAGERIAAMLRSGELLPGRISYANIAQAPGFFTRGFSRGDRICMGPSGAASNDLFLTYAAHEIGHELGRNHPTPASDVCGHSASDPAFPYPRAAIGETSPLAVDPFFGLDLGQYSFDPLRVLSGRSHRDFMSYCRPKWISDYTYEGIYQRLATMPVTAAVRHGTTAGLVEGDWLIATGILTPAAGNGGFGIVRRVPTAGDPTPPEPGPFTLELAAGDGVLASHPFTALPIADGAPGYVAFDLMVPFLPGTTALRVVENDTGRALASAVVSASPPVISDVALPDAPDPVDGLVTVTWTASDPDGDALQFDLFATRDGGTTFTPVELSIAGTTLSLDSTRLAGGLTQLRVVATDGVHTAAALSAPFTVAARPPEVVIVSPPDGQRVDWNQLVTFEAAARDLQDGTLVDEAIVWANQYGDIGTGAVVQTSALQVGTNTVSVTATNSAGLSASASIVVEVGDALAPLGPTLSVEPQAIGWHVDNGDLPLQTEMLEISNAGSGTLEFEVQSDAAWLLLDGALGASGVAPAVLTVSADPAMIPPGTAATAMLTVRATDNADDERIVTVELARGDVFNQTGSVDADGDGVMDAVDNCQAVANPDQTDADDNGIGDACEGSEPPACAGDCDGDRAVAIDELIRAVTIALGSGAIDDCAAADGNGDGNLVINELIAAVNVALLGC